jgi:hypothetical protein
VTKPVSSSQPFVRATRFQSSNMNAPDCQRDSRQCNGRRSDAQKSIECLEKQLFIRTNKPFVSAGDSMCMEISMRHPSSRQTLWNKRRAQDVGADFRGTIDGTRRQKGDNEIKAKDGRLIASGTRRGAIRRRRRRSDAPPIAIRVTLGERTECGAERNDASVRRGAEAAKATAKQPFLQTTAPFD